MVRIIPSEQPTMMGVALSGSFLSTSATKSRLTVCTNTLSFTSLSHLLTALISGTFTLPGTYPSSYSHVDLTSSHFQLLASSTRASNVVAIWSSGNRERTSAQNPGSGYSATPYSTVSAATKPTGQDTNLGPTMFLDVIFLTREPPRGA